MKHKDFVDETIETIQKALDEYDALRESPKNEAPWIDVREEYLKKVTDRPLGESPKEDIVNKIIKHNLDLNNMETNTEMTVIEQLDHRLNSSLGELNDHKNKLGNIILNLTGESFGQDLDDKMPVDSMGDKIVREPSLLEKFNINILRLEQINEDFNRMHDTLNKYL